MDGVQEQTGESDAQHPRRGAKTLIEFAYKSLRKDIISGELAPGSKLRIEHLRAKYEIGSSTLREALTLLVADALVISEGQRGFKVAPISLEDLKDVTRMRKMMETMALMEAIENGDDHWEGGIVAAFHRLSRIEERLHDDCKQFADDWEERNNAFHQALISACPSRWVLHFREILYHQSERYRRFSLISASVSRDVHAEHKAIMDATLARDKEQAGKLLDEHMDRTLTHLTSLLADSLPERS
ncbi:MAG TPA: FCD domain-containing protein [Candidatus Sulfotelmatobacter sp.]|jgi:DNA-binding GntR family transcriptional regulator|nr:FCD domain-containing protein [Candidatus Sulfotelmatobacter sp.]